MSLAEKILGKVRAWPPEQQREVVEFAEGLSAPAQKRPPLRSPRGFWAGLDISISQEDIDELGEVRKNFPREDTQSSGMPP